MRTPPPVLQLTSPSNKTYTPGSAADDNSPSVDFIAFEHSPTKSLTNVKVVPTNDVVIPSPGGTTSGCEMSDFPAATSGAVSLIQRGTCGFTLKLQNAVKAGAVGVILFNEGDTAGRSNALFRSADPGYTIPAVLSSFAVGEELYNLYKGGQNPTVNLATSGVDVETLYPNVVAETKRGDANHMVLRSARTWTRSRRVRASTTTARARRSSSSWPSSSPRRARRRATRSASCGSAARRTAWSARSTTPPTCPTPRSRART